MRFLDPLFQDLSYGLRSLTRTPLVSLAAVVTLALGIGVTSAIYAAFDVWLLRPLPLPDADRLVTVMMANNERGSRSYFSVRDFQDWREESLAVDLAVRLRRSVSLLSDEEAEQVTAVFGSWNLLKVLGLTPNPGRGFLPEDERWDTDRSVILTEGFWERTMGRDPGALGREVLLDGDAYTVVGILPDGPRLPEFRGDVWIPLRVRGDEGRTDHSFQAVGRLRSGFSLEQARHELEGVASAVAARDPERRFPDAHVTTFREAVYGDMLRGGGLALIGAVVFVLLIACANIANLMFARGLGRTQEIAIRGALGASRVRIFGQLLGESFLIAAFGGVLGTMVAYGGVELLIRFVLNPDIPGWDQIRIDLRVLGALALVTIVAALLSGLLPAIAGSRSDLRGRLQQAGRGDSGQARLRAGPVLIVSEVTLALTLLVLTGLVIKSLYVTYRTDIGFRTEQLVTFRMSPPVTSYPEPEHVASFQRAVLERIRSVPGVLSVGASNGPAVGRGSFGSYSPVDGVSQGEAVGFRTERRVISEGYRDVLGLEMLAGRWIDDGVDVDGAPEVAVVSRTLAEQHWSSPRAALGRRIRFGEAEMEIVGVVEAGRAVGPQAPPPVVLYQSANQYPARNQFYVVSHGGSSTALMPLLRSAVGEVDATLAVFGLRTVEDEIRQLALGQVATFRLFGTLAALAVILTLVGVYGVMLHEVGRRRREFGIRAALGADRALLVSLTLRRSGRVVGLGLTLGVGLSLLSGRVVAALLQGVSPYDPTVLLGVSAGMFGVSLLASYLPARKGASVDAARVLME